jgi:hypothetical protein
MASRSLATVLPLLLPIVLLVPPANAEIRGEVIYGALCEPSASFTASPAGVQGGLVVGTGVLAFGAVEVTCGLVNGSHSTVGATLNWGARQLKLLFLQVQSHRTGSQLTARLCFQDFMSNTNFCGPSAVATGTDSLMLSPPTPIPSSAWSARVSINVAANSTFTIPNVNPLWWQ